MSTRSNSGFHINMSNKLNAKWGIQKGGIKTRQNSVTKQVKVPIHGQGKLKKLYCVLFQ